MISEVIRLFLLIEQSATVLDLRNKNNASNKYNKSYCNLKHENNLLIYRVLLFLKLFRKSIDFSYFFNLYFWSTGTWFIKFSRGRCWGNIRSTYKSVGLIYWKSVPIIGGKFSINWYPCIYILESLMVTTDQWWAAQRMSLHSSYYVKLINRYLAFYSYCTYIRVQKPALIVDQVLINRIRMRMVLIEDKQ